LRGRSRRDECRSDGQTCELKLSDGIELAAALGRRRKQALRSPVVPAEAISTEYKGKSSLPYPGSACHCHIKYRTRRNRILSNPVLKTEVKTESIAGDQMPDPGMIAPLKALSCAVFDPT
jgi:hypothetical protein